MRVIQIELILERRVQISEAIDVGPAGGLLYRVTAFDREPKILSEAPGRAKIEFGFLGRRVGTRSAKPDVADGRGHFIGDEGVPVQGRCRKRAISHDVGPGGSGSGDPGASR